MRTATHSVEFPSPGETWSQATVIETPSILLVEDDRDCSHGMSIWLRKFGYEVMTAMDGAVALQELARKEFGAVILDLGLPGMHGLKVLHQLRMQSMTVPVVVATATSDAGSVARAHAMGAVEVLRKPVDVARLRTLLQELLDPFGGLHATEPASTPWTLDTDAADDDADSSDCTAEHWRPSELGGRGERQS